MDPESIYDRTAPKVFGLLLRILERRSVAEEVLLDVFTQAWKEGVFDSGSEIEARLLDLARSRGIEQLRNGGGPTVVGLPDWTATTGPSPEDQVGIEGPGLMASLEQEDRTALELAYYFGMTTGEIALQLKLPREAVRRRLTEAMTRLHEILRNRPEGDP